MAVHRFLNPIHRWTEDHGGGNEPRPVLRPTFLVIALLVVIVAATLPHGAYAAGVQDVPRTDVQAADPLDLGAELPFRDEIRYGRLANGLEYFAVEHPFPDNTVVLRLVVDAGSVLETDDQRGLAHFVEHMAFNGTEEFDEDELVSYLEGLGIRFGPDLNASTSFDETIYKLEIPADDEEALTTGFRVMHQWASAIAFAPEAIERERGVIVEEWRGGRTASRRMLETHIPVLLGDSRYTERLPIGEMDVVRTAPRSEFLDFYDRWYRPDNMAFIAAGDIPAERMVDLVREYMDDLPRPERALERPYFFVPRQDTTRVSIAGDPEATTSTVSLYVLDDPQPAETVGDYREQLVRSLFSSVVNERMREIARDPSAPILGGGVGWFRFLRDTEITSGAVAVREHRVIEAFELLIREIERAERFGVLDSELERAKNRMLQGLRQAEVNFASRHAAVLAEELVRHWTQGEAVPGIEFEKRLYEELLPTITAEEVQAVAERYAQADGRVILADLQTTDDGTLPNGAAVPTEEEFFAALARSENAAITAPEETETAQAILERIPEPGSVAAVETHAEVETEELILSNGMRVFVKPTELSRDEVLVSAYSPGGLAVVADELVGAARLVSSVVRESGIGTLDASALERFLAGRSVNLSAYIGRTSEGFSGSARGEDVELLFQMIHAAFTAPRFGREALNNVRQQTLQGIEGTRSSPQGRFSRRFQELFAAGDPRLGPPQPEDVEQVTLEEIRTVYRDRFANPADFALFIVGSVDTQEITALAARYLATIPGGASMAAASADGAFTESIPAERYPRPEGIVSDIVAAGTEPVAQLVMVMHGPYRWSQEENHRFNSLGTLLDTRLREEIREAAGGAYSVGAGGWRWRRPEPWAFMQIGFGLDPDRLEELRIRTLEVVNEVATTAPADDYVERIRAQQLDQYEKSLQENEYWLSALEFAIQHDRDPATILAMPELIDSLTAEDLRRTAERYLTPDRRIELVLVPETNEE